MSKPSEALRALQKTVGMMPTDNPVTWWDIYRVISDAITDQEFAEYSEYMGEDE